MSAPIQRDEIANDPAHRDPAHHDAVNDALNDRKHYAPPWVRKRPLPAASQPQTNAPPVASAVNPTEPPGADNARPRLSRGVGGPNISWTSRTPMNPANEAFSGDVAGQALRRRLALEPDAIPEPPIVMRRQASMPWTARVGLVCLAAGIAAFGLSALWVTSFYTSAPNRTSEFNVSSGGFVPAALSTDRPSSMPASLLVKGGRAVANEPVPLGVSLKGSSGDETIFITGLKDGTHLSPGVLLDSKGWRVRARELDSVRAHAPINYVGVMHAAVNLYAANSALVDTQVVRLEWVARAQPAPPAVANTRPAAPAAAAPATAPPSPPPVAQISQAEVETLLKRARLLLEAGDIAPARLMLQRAAVAGSAAAALLLGGTYDPDVLREFGVLGFAADANKALDWYQKALALGSDEATRRIGRLAQSKRVGAP